MDSIRSSEDIHPTIRCSRNLKRRTGFLYGLTVWEFITCSLFATIPTILQGMGIIEESYLLTSLLMSAVALVFMIVFKRNRQANYFSLWIHHHLLHPNQWRAPARNDDSFPIIEEKNK